MHRYSNLANRLRAADTLIQDVVPNVASQRHNGPTDIRQDEEGIQLRGRPGPGKATAEVERDGNTAHKWSTPQQPEGDLMLPGSCRPASPDVRFQGCRPVRC